MNSAVAKSINKRISTLEELVRLQQERWQLEEDWLNTPVGGETLQERLEAEINDLTEQIDALLAHAFLAG